MILIRQLFSSFATQNTTSEQENQCKNMRFEFRFLETHHSTIPLFHHSNWGKAPKFRSQGNILQFLSAVTSKKICNRSVKIVMIGHRTELFNVSEILSRQGGKIMDIY